jgi:hypothetical protein
MYVGMAVSSVRADDEVLMRAFGADPRSDWLHGYSSGELVLTDRRLAFRPWPLVSGPDGRPFEVTVDSIDRVSSVPVPVWLFGLVRVWLHGVRLVTVDGTVKTVVLRRARAAECVTTLEAVLRARRRSSDRVGATPPR